MLDQATPQLLIPVSEARLGEIIAEKVGAAQLGVATEAARRALLGEYLNDKEAQRETGLSRRQLRRMREERRVPYRVCGRACLYRATDLFALVDAGLVPARASNAVSPHPASNG